MHLLKRLVILEIGGLCNDTGIAPFQSAHTDAPMVHFTCTVWITNTRPKFKVWSGRLILVSLVWYSGGPMVQSVDYEPTALSLERLDYWFYLWLAVIHLSSLCTRAVKVCTLIGRNWILVLLSYTSFGLLLLVVVITCNLSFVSELESLLI